MRFAQVTNPGVSQRAYLLGLLPKLSAAGPLDTARSADARLLQTDGFHSTTRSGILVPVKIDRSKYDAGGKLKNGAFKGRFVAGKMTGAWKWYRENGKLMQAGSFVDERKSGVWKRYHPNGSLYDEGRFVDNQKVGEWRVYDAKGKPVKTARHKSAA
jgi:hypothetical protein